MAKKEDEKKEQQLPIKEAIYFITLAISVISYFIKANATKETTDFKQDVRLDRIEQTLQIK
jgi:hypothetical protein